MSRSTPCTEAKTADALHEGVDGLIALATGLKAASTANVPVMNEVEQSLGAYRKAFDEFVSLSQAKDLALEMASWSVSSVANNLDVLQAGLADDGAYTLKQSEGKDGGQFLEQASQVSQVSRLMLQAMNEARVRLDQSRKGDDSAGQGKIEQADQALTQAERLKTTVKDEGYQTVLNEVTGHIGSFSEKLTEYTGLLAQEKTATYEQLHQRAAQEVEQVDRAPMSP